MKYDVCADHIIRHLPLLLNQKIAHPFALFKSTYDDTSLYKCDESLNLQIGCIANIPVSRLFPDTELSVSVST
jgi:hypothetical protein